MSRLKLMLLGGSRQQVIAIEKAKALGYDTVLCDYLPDNPGQHIADKFYQTSTTDKELVLDIAIKEEIDGILSYASDPAAPTAAYVAEKMGLPGNSTNAVDILGYKHLFRSYQKELGFPCPNSHLVENYEDYDRAIDRIGIPCMVKPIDSAGSKGVTRLTDTDDKVDAFKYAMTFSKSRQLIVEEYVRQNHRYMIAGDCFVIDGEVVFWGLLNSHRSLLVNDLVPNGTSYPLCFNKDKLAEVKAMIVKMIRSLSISFGGFNIEVMVDDKGRIFIIELGPRNGGNMIPDFLHYLTGFDMIEASIQCALGQPYEVNESFRDSGNNYMAAYVVHAMESGILQEIDDSKLGNHVVERHIYYDKGTRIELGDLTHQTVGVLYLVFENEASMLNIMDDIHEYVHVIIS